MPMAKWRKQKCSNIDKPASWRSIKSISNENGCNVKQAKANISIKLW